MNHACISLAKAIQIGEALHAKSVVRPTYSRSFWDIPTAGRDIEIKELLELVGLTSRFHNKASSIRELLKLWFHRRNSQYRLRKVR
jgi:hypothetical protein